MWLKATGLLGLTAVALGAYGAHGLQYKSENMKEVWKTASFYHFIHTIALGMSASTLYGTKKTVVCALFVGGIVLFSGSCYLVAFIGEKKPFNRVAPFGGVMLMGAWLAFGFM